MAPLRTGTLYRSGILSMGDLITFRCKIYSPLHLFIYFQLLLLFQVFCQKLQEKVGSNVVEAMLSSSAPVFYGDLRSHERVRYYYLI